MIYTIRVYRILKYYGRGSQDRPVRPSDKKGEGWLEQSALVPQGRVAKWVKYLQDVMISFIMVSIGILNAIVQSVIYESILPSLIKLYFL
jgi:hypothetical protein